VKILTLTSEKPKAHPIPQMKSSLMSSFLSSDALPLRGAKVVEDPTVSIDLCANGGHEGHDFIALYLSNGRPIGAHYHPL
jgi:hypothetical protein